MDTEETGNLYFESPAYKNTKFQTEVLEKKSLQKKYEDFVEMTT